MSSKTPHPDAPDLGSVAPGTLERLSRADDAARNQNGGVGNPLLALRESIPGRRAELLARREVVVAELRGITAELVELETHDLIAEPDSGTP